MGEGTHAVFAPARGWPIFCAIMSAIASGAAHMPLPICARPASPAASPTSTFRSSYAAIQRSAFISVFGMTGPASIEVWISSPVRSRNPVLMKMTRDFAARMHSARFTVVRRSSSMMPILTVSRSRPSASSTRSNSSTVAATSSGPWSFGLTMYTLPVRLFANAPRRSRSCFAASTVTIASRKPSGMSLPSPSRTASVYMWIPTLRTSMRLRPGSSTEPPPGAL